MGAFIQHGIPRLGQGMESGFALLPTRRSWSLGWVCLTCSRRGLYSPAMEGPEQAGSSVCTPALPPTPYQPGQPEEQGIAGWTREETPWECRNGGAVPFCQRTDRDKSWRWESARHIQRQEWNNLSSLAASLRACPMQFLAHNRFLISIAIESHGMYQG